MNARSLWCALGVAIPITLCTSAALANAHCWCKVIKSDCGDCSNRCVFKNFGSIAEFKGIELGREAKCRAYCGQKLAALTEAAACTGLSQELRVPMPWRGEVHACSAVGTGGYSPAARKTVSCTSQPSGFPPAGAPYWRLTFADEFQGRPANPTPAEAACYDQTAKCWAIYRGGVEECPAAAQARLRHLNKCTWTVLIRNNWMFGDHQVNAFDAREVTVDPTGQGTLILSARGLKPDGSYSPEPTPRTKNGKLVSPDPYLRQPAPGYDCVYVTDPWNNKPYRDKCPIISGAVVSASGGGRGFKQKYGRFEIRAKLPYGPGSFPAQWLLPQEGSWPGAGELDIIEAYTDGDYVNQGVIGGLCMPAKVPDLDPVACEKNGGKRWSVSKGLKYVKPFRVNPTPFWQGFHTYAIEWSPDYVRYFVDGVQTVEFKHLDLLPAKRTTGTRPWLDKLAFWHDSQWKDRLPFWVPDREFFMILNQSIKKDDNHKIPNPKAFVPQQHVIDYVRVYQRCLTPEDFCPNGGTFEIATGNCRGAAPYPSPCKR